MTASIHLKSYAAHHFERCAENGYATAIACDIALVEQVLHLHECLKLPRYGIAGGDIRHEMRVLDQTIRRKGIAVTLREITLDDRDLPANGIRIGERHAGIVHRHAFETLAYGRRI